MSSPSDSWRRWIVGGVFVACAVAGPLLAAPRGKSRPQPAVSASPASPECRPGRHTLTYHGGDLVTHDAPFIIFWGAEWQTDPEHRAAAAALRIMFQHLAASPYGCSWQEWELPGSSIGAGSPLGDEVIAAEPVEPGKELDDAVIQDRIVTEVKGHRAPPVSDDVVYVIVPPRGVAVRAGGETGCGGSNFTFCGYHDSFTNGGARFRYAVLPYPCTEGGFTCFVDPQQDPSRAFEAIGSHELAEIVTDPDTPPVGKGGWFDDRTGFENADLCESDACLADLPVGAHTFTVNSLWSNLGGGCVVSAPCAPPPIECTDPAPGACSANTQAAQGCALEWLVDPNLTTDRRSGFPGDQVSCADGQPFCDSDGKRDGACTFRVAACLNNTDARLACTPSSVSAVQLNARLAGSGDPTNQADASTLLAALATVDPGSTGTVSGSRSVAFTPAASMQNACTGYLDIVVPVHARGTLVSAGAKTLDATAQTPAGPVKARLSLVCAPTFP